MHILSSECIIWNGRYIMLSHVPSLVCRIHLKQHALVWLVCVTVSKLGFKLNCYYILYMLD